MNTIQVQLSEKEYDSLMGLLDYAEQNLGSDIHGLDKEGEDTTEVTEMLGQHEDITKELIATKSYLWSDGLCRLELEIPADAVDEIAQPGTANDAAVARWLEGEGTNYLRAQVEMLSECGIREVLDDAGIDEVDGKSEEEVRRMILWMACWDIYEERNQED